MSDMEAADFTSEMALSLHRDVVTSATQAAEIRGAVGARIKALQESHGLNSKAFKMASTIRKMENGKREHFIRDLNGYMELLQCNQQKDIMDTMADNGAGKVRTDLEKAMDGQPIQHAADADGRPITDGGGETVGDALEGEFGGQAESRVNAPLTPRSPMGKHHLDAFSNVIREESDREAITRGLERFAEDHPKLAEEAGVIVRDRLGKLAADLGGGEDLRPTVLREGEQAEAAQAKDTGKRAARGKGAKAALANLVH